MTPQTKNKRKNSLPAPQKTVQLEVGCTPVKIIDVGLSIYPINYSGSFALHYATKKHGAVILVIAGKKMTFNKPILETIVV